MYRRHVAAVHPPEEASLCLRWGCIQEQPIATSIPLIPFSFSPFFSPPLLFFSFDDIEFHFWGDLRNIYTIDVEDSKFFQDSKFFLPPLSSHWRKLRNNVQTNFSTAQPARSLHDDLGLSSLLRTSVSVLTSRWTTDYHERSKKDRLCWGPEPGKPKISQGLPKILTRHDDRRAKS